MSETASMTIVERVARALFAIRMEVGTGAGLHEPYEWEAENKAYREHCLREARAAIDALPRDEMEARMAAKFKVFWPEILPRRELIATLLDAALTDNGAPSAKPTTWLGRPAVETEISPGFKEVRLLDGTP